MNIKPYRDNVLVEIIDAMPQPDSHAVVVGGGLLATVISAGPEAKGVKDGDTVLVSAYCAVHDAIPPYRRLVSSWELLGKIVD